MKDASQQTPSPPIETKPNDKPADPPKPVVPESYTFKAPDGQTFDQSIIDKATPVFKELGLDQASAQKLVDLVAARETELAKTVKDMREGWRQDVSKDPEMGGKLETVKADIGRMKDVIFGGDKTARDAFEAAMNLTGAGDHPAIVKAWWKASEAFREGQHVSGGNPSAHGQRAPGEASRPSAAAAMYPNLPH